MRVDTDFLIIGSGVAGLTLALELSEHGTVTCVTKRSREDSATNYAQGGIAAVLDPTDSFDAHVADTLTTGGGLSHRDVVEMVIADGPARIRELMEIGAKFSRTLDADGNETEDFDLTREGGHSARRVIHAGDITGREVQRALVAAVLAQPRIKLLEHHMAIDLLELSKFGGERRVAGAYVLDEDSGEVLTFVARATVLATGGAGKVYLYTSNPDVASGDGVAMAYRAGALLANMEFFQFHPTCLFHPKAKSFLISEALRGEGGILRLADGTAFADVATELGLDVQTKRGLKRDADDADFGKTGVAAVFGVAKDQAGVVAAPDETSQVLFKVTEVFEPVGAGPDSLDEAARNNFASGLSDDLLDQLVAKLQTEYSVTIDQAAIRQALSF